MKSTSDLKTGDSPDRSGPSWAWMLILIFVAILAAAGIAWLMVRPFFAPHP